MLQSSGCILAYVRSLGMKLKKLSRSYKENETEFEMIDLSDDEVILPCLLFFFKQKLEVLMTTTVKYSNSVVGQGMGDRTTG